MREDRSACSARRQIAREMRPTISVRLVEGLFECEDRGQPTLKGVTTPLTLYRVLKEGEAQSRFQVVARKGLTPLVGREHEFGLLCERWERVRDWEGQIVLLSGEPGIGKSRLVEALKDSLKDEGGKLPGITLFAVSPK